MGIRFVCPNGHRLNVKTFLAGKRGICPHCGTKVDIPHESSPEAIRKPSSATSETQIPLPPRGVPAAIPAAALTEDGAPDAMADTEPVPVGGTPEVAAADPFASEATWYVHTSDGQQYGPATSEQMRQWAAEGRVAPSCLVWRDDWPEWKQAAEVLTDVPMANAAAIDFSGDPAAESFSVAPVPYPHRLRGRRKSEARAMMTVGLLAIACIILFCVFLFVVVGF